MPVANILDPIHDTLDPRVWDDPGADKPVLKPKHLHWIKKTIYDALTKAGYTDVEKWLTLVLTGSLTTYQYSNESDCDVSLFVNAKALPEWSRAEMIGVMVGNVDGTTLPGTPFPMQDFVVPPDIKPDDLYKEGLRSGYDLETQKWIVPPDRSRVHDVQAEENGFYSYALQMADKMERLLKYEPEKAIDFWHAIHKRRQADMRAGKGDFAESNIIYKFLANRGLFPAISEASGEYIAKTAMLDELEVRPNTGWFDEDGEWKDRYRKVKDQTYDTLADKRGPGESRVAYFNGEPIASVTWIDTPTHTMIGTAYTHPDYRGQGIFDYLTQEIRESGKPIDAIRWHNRGLERHVQNWAKPVTSGWGKQQAHTSMAVPLYHVAPTSARESIERHGLMGHERGETQSPWSGEAGQPPGNYFWDDPEAAEAYAYPLHDQIMKQQGRPQPENGHYPGDSPEDFFDHGIYDGMISTPSEEDEDEYEETPYDDTNPEHRGMLPTHLQGYDVWHVPEHGLQNVQRDPENQLVSGGDWITPEQALERTKQMYDEHGDPNYEGSGAHRYYTPEHVPPEKLSLHTHIPAYAMTMEDMYDKLENSGEREYPEPYHHVPIEDWTTYKPPEHEEWEASTKKTGASALYNEFRPDPLHPKTLGEQQMPWVYDPDTQVVHLGPPRAYHWQLIQRTPELRGQYQGAWKQPASQAGTNNVHGAMKWPSRETDFMGAQVDPETKRQINQALGAPEPDEHEWNFE